MSLTCLSIIAFLMAGRPSSGGLTLLACINAQRTTRGIRGSFPGWAGGHYSPAMDPAPERPSLVRAIGRWDRTAAVSNGTIGSSIFGMPAVLAALTGAWSPLTALIEIGRA